MSYLLTFSAVFVFILASSHSCMRQDDGVHPRRGCHKDTTFTKPVVDTTKVIKD